MKKIFYAFFTIVILLNGFLNAQTTCPNLVTNADFEAGVTGFTSALAVNTGCVINTYNVNTNFTTKCPTFPSRTDHTTGTGKFLIVQNSTAVNVWQNTVTVTPNTPYTFSFWVANGVTHAMVYAMMVNNVNVNQITATQATPTWTKYTFNGVSPAGVTSLPIAIKQITFGEAYIYGIDDVSFTSCVNCKAEFTFTNINNCGNVQFTNTSILPTLERPSYSWNFGDGTTSTLQSPSHQFSTCGTYNVCMIVNGSGCRDTVCHTVTVIDNTPPVARCKPGVGVILDANCQYNVTSAFVDNGSTDNCQIKSLVVNPAIIFGCANTTVTLTVTDWCNNRSTCTMGIQTTETVPPSMTCPPNMTVMCTKDTVPTITGRPTVADNCPGTVSLSYTDVITGTLPCNGTIRRTWTARDVCGNTATCVQTITVNDNTPPIITNCPTNQTVNTNAGQCYYTFPTLPVITATDNCDPSPSVTYSYINSLGITLPFTTATQFPKGVTFIKITARDACNNVSRECAFTITVVDNQKPTITCPLSITVVGSITPPSTLCKAIVNGLAPTVTDNCPMVNTSYTIASISNGTTGSGNNDASGTSFMGTSSVTYTATDMGGNTASCSFTVTVRCDVNPLDTFCGKTVITCFSGFNNPYNPASGLKPNGPVVAIVDPRALTNTIANGMDAGSTTPMFKNPSWVQSRMGQVFGIAIDANQDIYVAATTIYGKFGAGTFGSAGAGGIYKINHLTNAVTDFVTTGSGAIGTNTILNTGSGIGNICYDRGRSQFFATNFTDGKIYCISTAGIVLATYDHPGSTTFPSTDATYIPLGDRPYGIQINPVDGKLYYTVWQEDIARSSNTIANEVWSIDVTSGGFVGAAACEVQIPSIASTNYSCAPSDLAFSQRGKMLIGIRSSGRDFPSSLGSPAHRSRIIEYSGLPPLVGPCNAARWGTPKIIYVGNYSGDAVSPNSNCSGGVDYGYGGYNFAQNKPTDCDELIWSTGDALKYGATFNYYPSDFEVVYGLAGMPASGNSQTVGPTYVKTSSYYIDMGQPGKTEFGDVEVFKCGCDSLPFAPCDSLMVMVDSIRSSDSCCYVIDLKNQLASPSLTKICANITTANWIFNTGSLALASGWSFALTTPTQICFKRTSGNIPFGNLNDVFSFCLAKTTATAPSVQTIVFDWYAGEQQVICKDTITTHCPGRPADSCLIVSNMRADCSQNDLEYCLNFTVTNLNSTPAYSLVLAPLPAGYAYASCSGCGSAPFGAPYGVGSWSFTNLGGLIPANGSANFCVKIVATTPVLTPRTVCLQATLEFGNNCCTSPKNWCFELKPCCNPCQNKSVTVRSTQDGNCCYAIDFKSNCDFGYFSKVEFDILTGGVYYGWHATSNTFCAPPTLTHACIQSNSGSTFPSGTHNNLFNFCFTDVNMPSEVPQVMRVTFWTTGINGQDSIACDTILRFNCPFKQDTCVFITNERIRCVPDSMKYVITLDVTNKAIPYFTAAGLMIVSDPTIMPNPVLFSSPLTYNNTTTVTFMYTPSIFPDPDGILPILYKLKNLIGDTCCNGNNPLIDTLILPPCDTCKCSRTSFSGLNYRPTQGAATRFITCGDTLVAVCNQTSFNWTLGGNFQCQGDSCRPVVPMTWTLTGPAGTFTQSGTMAGPNFSLSLASAYLSTAGMYNLALTALCGTDTCRCNFKINAAGCPKDTCATRPCVGNLTWQNILNATFIKDMVTYQGKLIIGGSFTLLGNNNIAAWDGTNWTSLGTGINGSVNALAVHNGLLYAGGTFSSPGNNIAVWNGTAWAAVGTGMNTVLGGGVFSLLSNGSELIAGGLFTTAGGNPASNIARWNGTSWSNLSSGTNGIVTGLGLYNNQLIAGGVFTTAGGNSTVNNIARWNGANWLTLGGGINLFPTNKGQGASAIRQLGAGGELVVGGRFMEASNGVGVANTQFIAKWNGTVWSALSLGVNNSFEGIYDLKIHNGELYAGGLYTQIGGVTINGVARWNGANWLTTLHQNRLVLALETYAPPGKACELYSAGEIFLNYWTCTTPVGEVAQMNLRIIPNPNPGIFSVELPVPATLNMSFRVTNLTGQTLLEKQAEAGKLMQTVEAVHLPVGLYFLQIVLDGKVVGVEKFVKQ